MSIITSIAEEYAVNMKEDEILLINEILRDYYLAHSHEHNDNEEEKRKIIRGFWDCVAKDVKRRKEDV